MQKGFIIWKDKVAKQLSFYNDKAIQINLFAPRQPKDSRKNQEQDQRK
jgi:hypothetical protein